MPRPPVLPVLDWKAVFASGLPFDAWLEQGESEESRAAIRAQLEAQPLGAHDAAWLAALPRDVHVVGIAEDWCGDVVRHVPVLARLERAGEKLHVRYIKREQHPDVFARFLTNGGEAIPKFVFLSDAFIECGNWGPMPADCRALIARGKACGDVGAARRKVSLLYEADPEKSVVVRELMALIDTASCTHP